MNETYTVTYKFNGETGTDAIATERSAIRLIEKIERTENAELISHSANINRAAYRY